MVPTYCLTLQRGGPSGGMDSYAGIWPESYHSAFTCLYVLQVCGKFLHVLAIHPEKPALCRLSRGLWPRIQSTLTALGRWQTQSCLGIGKTTDPAPRQAMVTRRGALRPSFVSVFTQRGPWIPPPPLLGLLPGSWYTSLGNTWRRTDPACDKVHAELGMYVICSEDTNLR